MKGKYSKWRPAEDEELTKLVFEHGPKDWHFIASKLTVPRSADSTCGRWTNFLFKKQKKEGNNVEGLRVTHREYSFTPLSSIVDSDCASFVSLTYPILLYSIL